MQNVESTTTTNRITKKKKSDAELAANRMPKQIARKYKKKCHQKVPPNEVNQKCNTPIKYNRYRRELMERRGKLADRTKPILFFCRLFCFNFII